MLKKAANLLQLLLPGVMLAVLLGTFAIRLLWSPVVDLHQSTGLTAVPQLMEDKLDINRATAEELELLPGIGPAIAQRIVDYRRQNGPFPSIEALIEVKGIGEKTLEALKPYITIGE